jgi:hypothetical protein
MRNRISEEESQRTKQNSQKMKKMAKVNHASERRTLILKIIT